MEKIHCNECDRIIEDREDRLSCDRVGFFSHDEEGSERGNWVDNGFDYCMTCVHANPVLKKMALKLADPDQVRELEK
jgi:hypothetical protein